MNLEDIIAQFEQELTWRMNEIRFLKNQLAYIVSVDGKDRYRKSLIVMLYSHYEGFCKTAFSIYIKIINDSEISCKDAVTANLKCL